MEINENVRKRNSKRKKILIVISIILGIVLVIGLLLIFMIPKSTDIEAKQLSDGLVYQYKLTIPVGVYDEPYYAGRLYFSTNVSFDELKSAYEKKGYVVEEALDRDNTRCLIISLYTKKGLTKIWWTGKYDDRYYQDDLCYHIEKCYFPYPTYFNDSATFQDYVDFYNSSLTEIVKVDNENQTIVVNAIDKYIGNTFNALVELRYTVVDGKVKMEINRINNIK